MYTSAMLYPRKLLPTLKRYLSKREIIVLTGMRRVGKTTLLKIIFKKIKSRNKLYLDLENPLDQKAFEEIDYNNILSNFAEYGLDPGQKMYVFLDEIQAKPEVVLAIKYLYDHYPIKFFLTGSSSFYLKNLFPESLAGRKFVFDLYPLDFEEFLSFKGKDIKFPSSFAEKDRLKNLITFEKTKKLYDEYLSFGGFPEVVLAKDPQEKKEKLSDIFKSYFEKEVKTLADFAKTRALRDLILLLASRVGQKIEINKLASEIGVSRATIYSYLSFLQGTYFISLISPFSRSVDREVSGAKKIYFGDHGLANLFAKISLGSLFENAVFNQIKALGKLNYYQKRSGAEIDFILNQDLALEIKLKGTKQDLHRLRKTAKTLNLSESYLITKDFKKEPGFIPASIV